MNNKAILMSNVVGAVFAVICLIALFYGASKLYKLNVLDEEQKSAKTVVDSLTARAAALEQNRKAQTNLQGFQSEKTWYLIAFTTQNPDRPDKCGLKNCLCICRQDSDNDKNNCRDNGFCRQTDEEIFVRTVRTGESVYDGVDPEPYKEITGQDISNADTLTLNNLGIVPIAEKKINIPAVLIQIHLEKEQKDGITKTVISHYTEDYRRNFNIP